MKKIRLSILIALVIVFSVVGVAYAITWGEPDNGEHPNVGTLLFVQNGVGYYSCTGTLIAPKVMLTAGHCVEEFGNINDVTYVRFEENALEGIGNYGSLQKWLDKEWLAVDTVIPHPLYDDFSGFPYTYDVGLVILKKPVNRKIEFATLPPLGFLETLIGQQSNDFTAVGYGVQSTLKPFAQDDYERYKGTVRLIEVNSMLTGKGYSSAKFTNNPGTGGGTCYGDSGGPTFFQDTNMTVSVTSFGWGSNHCVGNDYNFRLDTSAAQDFIGPYLK